MSILRSILRTACIALVAVTIGVLSRKFLLPGLEGKIVWVTFYPTVAISAVLAGWLCGTLTALGSSLVALYAWPLFVTTPFINDSGDWLGLCAFLFNCLIISGVAEMTHRARKQAESAREQAESANRAKSLFLANMSHEIRTPMNAVLGFAQLLARDPSLSPEASNKVATITKSGEHLLAIINDILEISRIEAGKIEAHPRPFNLRNLLDDLTLMFRLRAGEKGLSLTLEMPSDLPPTIMADLDRLRQILINLLGNAVKFTPAGNITLRALAYDGRSLTIEVADTGIGISTTEQELLFRPFERTPGGAQMAGGTGLGLAISRQYALLMGGDVTFTSAPGQGSCFRVTLPVTLVDSVPAVVETTPRIIGLQPDQGEIPVLVVDDTATNRELLRELLTPLGFSVIEAVNGREALAGAFAGQPRVVLMDLVMPVMNGIEATRELRRTFSRDCMTIIGISASAFEQDRKQLIDAGVDAYLSKPFHDEELLKLFEEHAGVRFVKAQVLPASHTTAPTRQEVADLTPLSFTVRGNLRQAAERLDRKRIQELAAEIGLEHPELGATLAQMNAAFCFEQLIALCGVRVSEENHD